MKKLFILLLLTSCAHHKNASDKEIDLYCQDLNVLHQKKALIESNIANIHTTRSPEGGYYKRRMTGLCKNGFCLIQTDERSPILKYEPKSPDANKQGYVAYPNINLDQEKYDLKQLRNVQMNVVKYAPVKNDFFLKDLRAQKCFEKYPFVNENYNYPKYLGR